MNDRPDYGSARLARAQIRKPADRSAARCTAWRVARHAAAAQLSAAAIQEIPLRCAGRGAGRSTARGAGRGAASRACRTAHRTASRVARRAARCAAAAWLSPKKKTTSKKPRLTSTTAVAPTPAAVAAPTLVTTPTPAAISTPAASYWDLMILHLTLQLR